MAPYLKRGMWYGLFPLRSKSNPEPYARGEQNQRKKKMAPYLKRGMWYGFDASVRMGKEGTTEQVARTVA